MNSQENFSVLIPVYHGDNPAFFSEALHSIYEDQTLKPNQIVIVIDGPIGNELYQVIERWSLNKDDKVTICKLDTNQGLGIALNKGLEMCKYELVARMDSDDLSTPYRFEIQKSFFENDKDLIICASNIAEFEKTITNLSGHRVMPENISQIKKLAKYRNPINHPTVMFKKKFIKDVGSYKDMPYFEDYYLWVRCFMAGFKAINIQNNLVFMRGGPAQLARRSGLGYAIKEFYFIYKIYKLEFINIYTFIFTAVPKFFVRLIPIFLIKKIYTFLRS